MKEAPEILKYFEYGHLPPHLQGISKKFAEVATFIVDHLDENDEEAEMALRKLLEAKDCAVRAAI